MSALRPSLFLLLALLGFACADTPPPPEPSEAEFTPVSWEPAPWIDEAVIYELFVPDFTEEGTFRAIIPQLPELRELGVTTLWLMPIHPIGEEGRKGVLGSPYAIRDYYDVNPDYGTKEDFRALVEAVHAEGMQLIIDFVANHTSPDNAWVEAHPDWFTRDAEGNTITPIDNAGNPTDWTDTVDLNYDNPELRAEMTRVLRYWIEEFDIDGYRCDVAGFVPMSFWADAIREIRTIKPILMLAEHGEADIHAAGFDLTYAWPEYAKLKEVWDGAPASELATLVEEIEAELPDQAGRLRFTTNHDETAWDAPPPVLFDGQAGAQAAFVLMASLPGAPLLYNGQETGVEAVVPFFEQTPYDWSQRPEVRSFYDQVLDLHAERPALQRGTLTFHAESPDALLFERQAGEDRLFVAVNVRGNATALSLPEALHTVAFEDALTGDAVSPDSTLSLDPYRFLYLQPVEGS